MSSAALTIPADVARQFTLAAGAKLVFSALCYFSSRQNGSCSPSQTELSNAVGQSVRSIQNNLQTLVQAGYIRITPGEKPWIRSSYQILSPGHIPFTLRDDSRSAARTS